jgi:hypothetical protein
VQEISTLRRVSGSISHDFDMVFRGNRRRRKMQMLFAKYCYLDRLEVVPRWGFFSQGFLSRQQGVGWGGCHWATA